MYIWLCSLKSDADKSREYELSKFSSAEVLKKELEKFGDPHGGQIQEHEEPAKILYILSSSKQHFV